MKVEEMTLNLAHFEVQLYILRLLGAGKDTRESIW